MCLKCAYFFENPEMARKWRFCYIADNQYNPLIADWLLFARFSTNEVSSAPHKKRAVDDCSFFCGADKPHLFIRLKTIQE